MFDRERPSFEDSNNVTVQRCFYAYEFAKPYITDKNTADIGCADGYGTQYLADFTTTTIGVDYSEVTITDARQKHAAKTNLTFKAGKVPPIPLETESVDVVTAFQFIEHIEHRKAFMEDVKRVLKPGGVFICTTPNVKMSIARNPFHVHEYTFSEMQKEASSIFSKIEFLQLAASDRKEVFIEVATQTGMTPFAVEKDWWVTLALNASFALPYSENIVFKGGTSLSKGWDLIERFFGRY